MSDVDECEEMETGNKRLYCKTNSSLKNLSCRTKVWVLIPTKIPEANYLTIYKNHIRLIQIKSSEHYQM